MVAGQQRDQPAVVVGHRRELRRGEPRGELGLAVAGGARLVVAPEPRERVGEQAGHLEVDGRRAADARRAALRELERPLPRAAGATAMQAAFAQPL